jgi:hypothetical protein
VKKCADLDIAFDKLSARVVWTLLAMLFRRGVKR